MDTHHTGWLAGQGWFEPSAAHAPVVVRVMHWKLTEADGTAAGSGMQRARPMKPRTSPIHPHTHPATHPCLDTCRALACAHPYTRASVAWRGVLTRAAGAQGVHSQWQGRQRAACMHAVMPACASIRHVCLCGGKAYRGIYMCALKRVATECGQGKGRAGHLAYMGWEEDAAVCLCTSRQPQITPPANASNRAVHTVAHATVAAIPTGGGAPLIK